MQGNPNFDGPLRLYCRHGYHLTIKSDGQVAGTQDEDDRDALLKIANAGEIGLVRIRGVESGRFLCFNPDGNLYGEEDKDNEGTLFDEHFEGSYTGYRSRMWPEWYVGLKKTGRPKKGPLTAAGQKAVTFLPRLDNY